MVKNPSVNAGDPGPGSGRLPGIGNGNTLQYSCHNSIDRVAWRAIFHRVTKSEAI